MQYRSDLVEDLGLFAKNLGDLDRAHRAFSYARELNRSLLRCRSESINAQNLAEVAMHAGHFPQVLEYAETAILLANEVADETQIRDSHVYRATAHFALGNINAALEDFLSATKMGGLYSLLGIWQAECKTLRGDRTGARRQTKANRDIASANNFNQVLCRCNALLARLLLPEDPADAARHLDEAREFAHRSGVVEHLLRCFHAACEISRNLGDYTQAINEAEAGILLADTCSFGKYSIDLRIALAKRTLTPRIPAGRCRTLATRSTARNISPVNTPGEKQMVCTSADWAI